MANDTISRQAAIDAMDTWDKFGCQPDGRLVPIRNGKEYVPYVRYEDMVHVIQSLPSAERRGRWIDRQFCSNYSGYDYAMKCSVCGKPTYRQFAEKMTNYCPNCGASMIGEEE